MKISPLITRSLITPPHLITCLPASPGHHPLIQPRAPPPRASRRCILTCRPPPQRARWYHDQRKVTAAVLVAGSAAVLVYSGNLETVPNTNRIHFVLVSLELERQLGESQFAGLKKELQARRSCAGDAQAEKLVVEYHERAVKALDVCNAARDGVDQLRRQSNLSDFRGVKFCFYWEAGRSGSDLAVPLCWQIFGISTSSCDGGATEHAYLFRAIGYMLPTMGFLASNLDSRKHTNMVTTGPSGKHLPTRS